MGIDFSLSEYINRVGKNFGGAHPYFFNLLSYPLCIILVSVTTKNQSNFYKVRGVAGTTDNILVGTVCHILKSE